MSNKELKEGDRFYFQAPSWVWEAKDDDVAACIASLMTCWDMNGVTHIDNPREEIKEKFGDLSEKQIDEIIKLLIKHKVIKPNKK